MNIKSFGNWNEHESWGFEAESLMNLGRKCSEDIVSYGLPPVAKGILGFYPNYHRDRVAKLANRLIHAIYRTNVLPPECREAVIKSPVAWQDLLYLLTDFGEYSVVLPDETPVPEGSIIIKPSTGDIFFAKNNVGMPVKEFLFWYTNLSTRLGRARFCKNGLVYQRGNCAVHTWKSWRCSEPKLSIITGSTDKNYPSPE